MPTILPEWLQFIDQLHSKKIDMGLQRVTAVAERLQLFPFKPFCITIAGTNGKGTTAAFIERALTQAGYQVGTMASPHLLRFNERLRINSQEIEDATICQAFTMVEKSRETTSLSYFEFVTLAGLYLFKTANVEVAILEVGMGGRLDAVNIIDADLAIITNIALDHMDYLGPDRESIGREKAGILRPHIPVIYGEQEMPNSVLEAIQNHQNQLFQFEKDYHLPEFIKDISPAIPRVNVANAIQALKIIQPKFPVSNPIIQQIAANFSLPGRWQVIHKPFMHIFDVAHNPHGIVELKRLLQIQPCLGKTYGIFSMLNTKEPEESLAIIRNVIDYLYVAPLQHDLSLNIDEITDAVQSIFPNAYKNFINITAAYTYAAQHMTKNDRLVVFGSFHTVAEVWVLIV